MALPIFTSGRRVRASELAALVAQLSIATQEAKDSSVTDGSTTATSFTNTLTTTGIRGVAFTAGALGGADVLWSMTGRNSTANAESQSSFEVRTGSTPGSGTVVWAADANTAAATLSNAANEGTFHSGIGTVTGLTAGGSYNVCIMYRTGGSGTAFYNRRRISVRAY